MRKHWNAMFVEVFTLEISLMFAWTLIISWKNIFQQNMNREGRKFSLRRISAIVKHHLQVSFCYQVLFHFAHFLLYNRVRSLVRREKGHLWWHLLADGIPPVTLTYMERIRNPNHAWDWVIPCIKTSPDSVKDMPLLVQANLVPLVSHIHFILSCLPLITHANGWWL